MQPIQSPSASTGILTEKYLLSLNVSHRGKRLSDRESMYGIVRTGQKGVSVLFRWRFRFNGKHFDFNCGTWPAEKLSAIRQNRRDGELVLRAGRNPNDEKRVTKLRAAATQQAELEALATSLARSRTVSDAMQDWFASKAVTSRKDKGAYVKRSFAKDIEPTLGPLPISAIKRGVVMDALHTVAERAPVMANRTHAQLNQFFEYCRAREWIAENPLHGTRRESIGGSEPARQRILCNESDPAKHELLDLKNAMPASMLPLTSVSAIWIILSTACRVGELSQARWDNVDLERGEWHIPSENTKNGRAHVVYLSNFANNWFRYLFDLTGDSEWCFPGTGGRHLGVKSITKQVGDRQRNFALAGRTQRVDSLLLPGGPWTPHDLRRTAATLMGHCGVTGEIIERCLNHSAQSSLVKIYQRQVPVEKMKEAWMLLGEFLERSLK